jgi:hypothetical protein
MVHGGTWSISWSLCYLDEYRVFEAAHRGMIHAMTGRGTVPGITPADVERKASLQRLRQAWAMLTAEDRIGLTPPPSTG